MAHFSNGTEGMMYQSKYCDICWNYRDKDDGRGFGCPIWDLHLLFVGEKQHEVTLNTLIPMNKDGIFAAECSMFLSKQDIDIKGQSKFDF